MQELRTLSLPGVNAASAPALLRPGGTLLAPAESCHWKDPTGHWDVWLSPFVKEARTLRITFTLITLVSGLTGDCILLPAFLG